MSKGIFFGEVKDGKVVLDSKGVFDTWVKTLEGQRIQLEVDKESEAGTVQQFRYLYACVYAPLAKESGHTVEEIDGILKKKFLTVDKGKKTEYVREKKSLNKAERAEYIDNCIMVCAQFGVVVLPPTKNKGDV